MQIKPLQKKTKVKRQAKSIKAKKVNSNLFNIGTMLGFNKSLLKIQLDKDIAKAILYRNSIDEEIMTRRLTGSTGNYIRIGDDHNIFFPYENDGFKIQYLTSQQTRKYNIQQQYQYQYLILIHLLKLLYQYYNWLLPLKISLTRHLFQLQELFDLYSN